nr:MAG: putative polyprotein [Picornavirales sp.]
MACSKPVNYVGNYQLFENITSLPREMVQTLREVQNMATRSQASFSSFDETAKVFSDFGKLGVDNLEKINNLLAHLVGNPNDKTFSIKTIIEKVKQHPIGLMANVINLARAHDLVGFTSCLVSMLSLIGLETPAIEAIRSRWENMDNTSRTTTGRFESYDKLPKLLCLLVSILGPLVLGTKIADFSNYLGNTKKSMASYKFLIEEIENIAEECGFGFSGRAKFVSELKKDFEGCLADMADFEAYLVTSPIRFCRTETFERFTRLGATLNGFIKNLATKQYSDFIGTSMSAEIRLLHARYLKLGLSVEHIRRVNAERVKPVGIVLLGSESQIGKSHLMTTLEKKVKDELKRRVDKDPDNETLQAFADAENWVTWNQNLRDKYDQNYQGQQIHAIDDAFSSKDELEQQALINFISNRPVPSYQAELAAKGIAYVCKIVMVSCNTFPRDSKTITNIHALAERFPIFVHVSLKNGHKVPETGFNQTFDWLDLHLTTGSKFFKKTLPSCPKNFCYSHEDVDIDRIVSDICNMLVANQERFDLVQEAMSRGEFQTKDEYKDAMRNIRVDRLSSLNMNREELLAFPRYQNFGELPSDIQLALRTSVSPLISISGQTSAGGNRFSDLMSDGSIDLHDMLLLYRHYQFVPLNRFAVSLNQFLQAQFFIGYDDHIFSSNGELYLNDVISDGTLGGDAESYAEEHCPTWKLLLKLFCDPEYLGIGALMTCLLFIGIPGAAVVALVMGVTTYVGFNRSVGKEEHEKVHILASLYQKAFVCFGLWIVAKIVMFFARKIKGLMSASVWKDHPEEKKIVSAVFEASALSFENGDLRFYPKDGTVVFVDENGHNFDNFRLFKTEPAVLGSSQLVDCKGVVVIKLCCVKDGIICPVAFATALNKLDYHIVRISSFKITPALRLVLEENGLFKKILCYTTQSYNAYNNSRPAKFTQVSRLETSDRKERDRRQVRTVSKYQVNQVPHGDYKTWRAQFAEEESDEEKQQQFNRHLDRLARRTDELNAALLKIPTQKFETSDRKERDRKAVRSVQKYEVAKKPRFVASDALCESEWSDEDITPSDIEMEEIRFENVVNPIISEDTIVGYPTTSCMTITKTVEKVQSGAYEMAVDPQANAVLAKMRRDCLVKLVCDKTGASLYGVGIGSHVIFPSHLVSSVGDIVRVTRMHGLVPSGPTWLATTVKWKREWELASAVIVPLKDKLYKGRQNVPAESLTFKQSVRAHVPLDCDIGAASLVKYTLQYLPEQGFIIPAMAQYVASFKGNLSGTKVATNIYAMRTMPFMNAQTIPGDCGGCVVMMNPSSTRKLIGLHIGSATSVMHGEHSEAYGLVALLTRDRVDVLTDNEYVALGEYQVFRPSVEFAEGSKYDSFDEMIGSGPGVHLPPGDESAIQYLGDLGQRQLPCDVFGRTDHQKTPFYDTFPVQKKPTVLVDSWVEDPSQLVVDADGVPSIIVTQLAGYGGADPKIDENEMKDMIGQMIELMSERLSGLPITTSHKFKTAMYEAINGQYWNNDFDKINWKTSSGIPWTNIGGAKKQHYLSDVRALNPYRNDRSEKFIAGKYLKNDEAGLLLQKVFRTKLTHAKQRKRTMSFWKVCLKDELQTLAKVKIGKTRAFIAPPMETFLMGRFLFGRWKAAFKAVQFDMFHAVGIDMKSLDVTRLVDKIMTHPNYIDMDYKNFDQRLLSQFMEAAAEIITETIHLREQNNEYRNARYTYFEEVIRTVLVANKTVFLTSHGNKSGNPLTTELNCIVNLLYSWFVFRRTTGMKSLKEYQQHVVDLNFGDDKILSVSDEVIDRFNFLSYQKEMLALNQIVTPGSKGDEVAACTRNIHEISFLKRHFVEMSAGIWIAPLEKASIESVFNYSSLSDEEIEEWSSTMMEQQIEAMLHGPKYYDWFIHKLKDCVRSKRFKYQYPLLREAVTLNVLMRYDHVNTLFCLRIGILNPSEVQFESIVIENGKVYYSGKAGITTDTCSQGKFESKNSIIARSEDTAMNTVASSIQYIGSRLKNIGLNYGNECPEEMNPEGPHQYQNVQSDIGPPVRVRCSDGVVEAFPLGQSSGGQVQPFVIPHGTDKLVVLPDSIKHFSLQETFFLNGTNPTHKETPTLFQVAPKARQFMRFMEYFRAKQTLLRVDCRPPMGYAHTVKIAVAPSDVTDVSVINRKGVTFDLADNPVMYFLIPFCDRDFMKTQSEPWFAVIMQQITPPVNSTTNPDPIYIRFSYELHECEYFVHRSLRGETIPDPVVASYLPVGSAADATVGATTFTHPAFGTAVPVGNTSLLQDTLLATSASIVSPTQVNGFLFVRAGSTVEIVSISSGIVQVRLPGRITIYVIPWMFLRGSWLEAYNAWISAYSPFNEAPVPALRLDTVRDIKQEKQTLKTVKHITAAEILGHPTSADFESRYLKNKGERGYVLPGHNYEGPGNSLNNGEPTTETDALSRKHDLQYAWATYMRARGKINDETMQAEIHAADEELARNANVVSTDGFAAWIGMRAKLLLEHFTDSLMYPATGTYQQKMDHVSQLKEYADKHKLELIVKFNRVASPDHTPIFECILEMGDFMSSSFGIGKKEAKQAAAELLLLQGEFQAGGADFDEAAAEPTVPMDTRPPIAVAPVVSNLAMGQTVGTLPVHIDVTSRDFIPIQTYALSESVPLVFTMRIHPGNFTANGAESQAQIAYRNHYFSGPVTLNGRSTYNTFKITSAANYRQNARLIVAQVPLTYSLAEVNALSAFDLKQFPNREHKLHGTETIFSPQWVNRLPVLVNHETGPTNTNGWLTCQILENSLSASETAPQLTLWVCADNVSYSMPITPAILPAVNT